MKVRIGKYRKWIGPYQIAGLLRRFGISEDMTETIGEWLSDNTRLYELCQWIHDRKNRRISVRIDDWDTWNMDETLSHVIYPMLIRMRELKRGYPMVDNDDIPTDLTADPFIEIKVPTTGRYPNEKGWEWILDEMIWAFRQCGTDWESEFYDGKEMDRDGCRRHAARMQNGFRLFGKYYMDLWS